MRPAYEILDPVSSDMDISYLLTTSKMEHTGKPDTRQYSKTLSVTTDNNFRTHFGKSLTYITLSRKNYTNALQTAKIIEVDTEAMMLAKHLHLLWFP